MEHTMKLAPESFKNMQNGRKMIEYRLNDEKRQELKVGDIIIFKNLDNLKEQISMKITKLLEFNSFQEAFINLIKEPNNDLTDNIEQDVIDMYQYYTKEDEIKYGCLAILLKFKK